MYINCKTCGKKFWIPKCREGYVKYCSKECRTPNLAGKQFGRLTALGIQRYKNGVLYEKCLCECGSEVRIQRRFVLHGTTLSCGCFRKETAKWRGSKNKTHGGTNTRLYRIFRGMFERCKYTRNDSYSLYGGRGIKCQWETFEQFRDDMQDSYEKHVSKYGVRETTIDRMDVNGDYCKENCRWATYREQMNNKRNTIIVYYKGERISLKELCRRCQIPYARTKDRIKKGWTTEDAVELPEVPQKLHKKGKDFIIKYLRECQKN